MWSGLTSSASCSRRTTRSTPPARSRLRNTFSVLFFSCRRRYTQHHHVTFKLREVVKPYKKVVGHAAVSLQGAVAACERGKAYSFMVPLRLQGLVCGIHLPPYCFPLHALWWRAFCEKRRRFVMTTRVFVCRYAAGQAEDAQTIAAIVFASCAACYSV